MKTTRRFPSRATHAPAPCTTYRPDADGNLVAVAIETREVVRPPNAWEEESVVMRWRVMAIQETGEECFVCRAATRALAQDLLHAHLTAHPEHRAGGIERIV